MKRWDYLVELYQKENLLLHNLTKTPMLLLTIQAGLTALKTSECGKEDSASRNVNCPACSEEFKEIVKNVPTAQYLNSSLVCRISGAVMDERNPPLVLPNGYCYSTRVFCVDIGLDEDAR
jgi:macrophage erythroblast attacher